VPAGGIWLFRAWCHVMEWTGTFGEVAPDVVEIASNDTAPEIVRANPRQATVSTDLFLTI
jgi:hypothetical protein